MRLQMRRRYGRQGNTAVCCCLFVHFGMFRCHPLSFVFAGDSGASKQQSGSNKILNSLQQLRRTVLISLVCAMWHLVVGSTRSHRRLLSWLSFTVIVALLSRSISAFRSFLSSVIRQALEERPPQPVTCGTTSLKAPPAWPRRFGIQPP